MTLAFTGHRPDKLGGYGRSPIRDWVITQLHGQLAHLRPDLAISGMALGVDQWAAQLCVQLGIPFIAAVPFPGQERVWTVEARKQYVALLGAAKEVVYVSKRHFSGAYDARNQWMVNRADVVLAVFDGSPGGTRNCVAYATQVQKPIIRIDPDKAGLYR